MLYEVITPSDLFTCKKCGECCKGYGGTFVTPEEIKAIGDYKRLDAGRFVAEFCRMSGDRPVLGQGRNGYCVFWDGLCTIHPVKPRMCKAWPFIKSVLVDIHNWRVMAALCPGIRIDVPDTAVQACIRKELLN